MSAYDYPVLMAADILCIIQTLYRSATSGSARELARDLAKDSIILYGDVFRLPEAQLKKKAPASWVDDPMKMSRARRLRNICPTDSRNCDKIMRAVTDSERRLSLMLSRRFQTLNIPFIRKHKRGKSLQGQGVWRF